MQINVALIDDHLKIQAQFQRYFGNHAVRDSSSDSSSSSEEEDLEILLCELDFQLKIVLGPHLNVMDLTNLQCEQLFRYIYTCSHVLCIIIMM